MYIVCHGFRTTKQDDFEAAWACLYAKPPLTGLTVSKALRNWKISVKALTK